MSFSRKLFVSGVSNAETMAGALIPKPNVTSSVWEHFGFQPNEKGEPANLDEPICKICGKRVPVTRVGMGIVKVLTVLLLLPILIIDSVL